MTDHDDDALSCIRGLLLASAISLAPWFVVWVVWVWGWGR